MRVCIFLFLAAICASLPAIAGEQVFTWVDGHGTVHYADTPPANGDGYKVLDLASSSVSAAVHGPSETQAETSDSADDETTTDATDTPETATASTSPKDFCAKLTSNIKLLKSKQIVVSKDAKGASKVMDAQARQQQLTTSEQQYKQFCQG